MKKNYKTMMKATNAIEPAAPASIWGKGVPGKGGKTMNKEIPDATFKRECSEMPLRKKVK